MVKEDKIIIQKDCHINQTEEDFENIDENKRIKFIKYYQEQLAELNNKKYGDLIPNSILKYNLVQITDIETKLLLLQQNKLHFNISDKLNNILNKGKNKVKNNFNKILSIIDEIINYIPDSIIAQKNIFECNNLYSLKIKERDYSNVYWISSFAKFGKSYIPDYIRAICFQKSSYKVINIIILYYCKDQNYVFPVFTKYEYKLNLDIDNLYIYYHKLNEYGFNTKKLYDKRVFIPSDYENSDFYIYFN
jgi:hypothetical protein